MDRACFSKDVTNCTQATEEPLSLIPSSLNFYTFGLKSLVSYSLLITPHTGAEPNDGKFPGVSM
jgi:hypothetical protein